MRLLLLGAAALGLARAIDDETPGFQFVSGERRGARRTCGGSFYTSGAAIDGGHSPGQRRHLDPQFLQTEETFYPPGALVPPWLIPPAVARPVGAPPIPAIAEEHSLTRGVVQTDGVVKSGKGFCAAEIGPGIIDVCFQIPYADRPAIAVTQQHPNDEVLELPIERLREIRSTDNCVIVSSCRCGFTAVCGDEGGNTMNQGGSVAPAPSRMAHFIADGPRMPTLDGSDHPCMKLIGAGACPPPPPPPPATPACASR